MTMRWRNETVIKDPATIMSIYFLSKPRALGIDESQRPDEEVYSGRPWSLFDSARPEIDSWMAW